MSDGIWLLHMLVFRREVESQGQSDDGQGLAGEAIEWWMLTEAWIFGLDCSRGRAVSLR